MRRLGPVLVALAVAGLLPAAAQAHLVSTGLGPYYDGMMHFLLTPEDLLPALALALLVGLNGAAAGRAALVALPTAWLAGGLAGLWWPMPATTPMLTPLLLLTMGAMVAADARVPLRWLQVMAVAMGVFLGYINGSAMAAAMLGFVGLAGIVSALFVALALAAAWVVALRAPWARVAVRVAGSWVAASGLLLLAWSVHAA